MEPLIEPSKYLHEDKITGAVYTDKLEAINSIADNAASDLFNLLKREGSSYSKTAIEIFEIETEIKQAIGRLLIVFNEPDQLLNIYKNVTKK